MRRLSAIRVREMVKIEEKRAPMMAGMCVLMNAYGHLKEHNSSDDESALLLLDSLIGPMEDENKTLCEKGHGLWQAVLALDGMELSSKEITKQQLDVEAGIERLEHVQRALLQRGLGSDLAEEDRMALVTVNEILGLLFCSRSELRQRQREYQLAQAKAKSENGAGAS